MTREYTSQTEKKGGENKKEEEETDVKNGN